MKIVLIWGTQLTLEYNPALVDNADARVLMIESRRMASKFKFHKQKLQFVLTAMRDFADELRDAGRDVTYITMEDTDASWFSSLARYCEDNGVTEIAAMRTNDRPPQMKLEAWCKERGIQLYVSANEQFLTSTALFNEWAEKQSRLQLEGFYRWQRKRLNVLLEENGTPTGGKWNFDSENRQPLPKDITLPAFNATKASRHLVDVRTLIDTYFGDHPGTYDDAWLPTSRSEARAWLMDFLHERFTYFGMYEDAMRKGETFLFHSALSALLNVGLLHASEVVALALRADVPLAAKEGFVRQIIGWREFMFGLYNFKPLSWKDDNFLRHETKLESWWWNLNSEQAAIEPPLADALSRLYTYGYSHHIERLMVFGNYMLLKGYNPQETYAWFMSMYVDAYEWVMVPNVIGMSQFADGGVDHGGFATKPYISGSNYLQKMGSWWPSAKDAKDSEWTPMYWDFLERHSEKLANNFRLRPLFATIERRKHQAESASDNQ